MRNIQSALNLTFNNYYLVQNLTRQEMACSTAMNDLEGLLNDLTSVHLQLTDQNVQDKSLNMQQMYMSNKNDTINIPSDVDNDDNDGRLKSTENLSENLHRTAFVASLSELDELLKELKTAKNEISNCASADIRMQQSMNSIDQILSTLDALEISENKQAITLENSTEELSWKVNTNEIEELMASLSDLQDSEHGTYEKINDLQSKNKLTKDENKQSVEVSVKCTKCDELLQHGSVFEYKGKIFCKRDLNNVFNPNCFTCNQPILNRMISAFGQNWHPEHFTCSICNSDFDVDGFHLSMDGSNKVYCRQCFVKSMAPKCNRCLEVILENYIVALKAYWHPACFSCSVCHDTFDSGYFYELNGKPFCETHYYLEKGLICYKCNKSINGRCITAISKRYHPEHFLCSFCSCQLSRDTFREAFNRPYCLDCHFKLFGN
ncbi:hypothetical protein GJ496_008683 [Pomphorhynchus laevis]|nr:hypothetical protein GJ496_008683 [Pomphorhynchus laevis]